MARFSPYPRLCEGGMMITIYDDAISPEEAAALATELLREHGASALGHGRMQLYAAVNQRNVGRVRLLTEVCLILMRDDRAPEPPAA